MGDIALAPTSTSLIWSPCALTCHLSCKAARRTYCHGRLPSLVSSGGFQQQGRERNAKIRNTTCVKLADTPHLSFLNRHKNRTNCSELRLGLLDGGVSVFSTGSRWCSCPGLITHIVGGTPPPTKSVFQAGGARATNKYSLDFPDGKRGTRNAERFGKCSGNRSLLLYTCIYGPDEWTKRPQIRASACKEDTTLLERGGG